MQWLDARQYGSAGMARFCMTDRSIADEDASAAAAGGARGRRTPRHPAGARRRRRHADSSPRAPASVRRSCATPASRPDASSGTSSTLTGSSSTSSSARSRNEVGVPKPDPRDLPGGARGDRDAARATPSTSATCCVPTSTARGSSGCRRSASRQIERRCRPGFSWDASAVRRGARRAERPTRGARPSAVRDADEVVASLPLTTLPGCGSSRAHLAEARSPSPQRSHVAPSGRSPVRPSG